MTLLERVKTLCNDNSITLSKLEKTLGFGNGTLSRWDDSSPSGDKLYKVASFFGVSIDYLVGVLDYFKIGIKIKNKRNVNKLSTNVMADRLGITLKEYLDIEKGVYEPPLKTYQDICKIFNISMNELFFTTLQSKLGEIDDEFYNSLDDSDKGKLFRNAIINSRYNINDTSYNIAFKSVDEYEKEIRNKAFFIEMCKNIGLDCSEFSFKNIPGFIIFNENKKLFIPRDNAFLILENTKDFFFGKLGNTLCYSEEITDNNLLNAAHADGVPTEEDIKKTDEIMDNDENWD